MPNNNNSSNNSNEKLVPNAKESLNKMKFETANQVGVNLNQGYNGNISARDAGRIGGNMVRNMIRMAEQQMTGKK